MITSTTTLKELYDSAVAAAGMLVTSGEKFIVKDLFTGVEWNRISKALRTKLGSMFLLYVNGSTEFAPVGKTPQNQQIYIKK